MGCSPSQELIEEHRAVRERLEALQASIAQQENEELEQVQRATQERDKRASEIKELEERKVGILVRLCMHSSAVLILDKNLYTYVPSLRIFNLTVYLLAPLSPVPLETDRTGILKGNC